MDVYILTKAIKSDPMEVDSVWSTPEEVQERIDYLMDDEYYERFATFRVQKMMVDDPERAKGRTYHGG